MTKPKQFASPRDWSPCQDSCCYNVDTLDLTLLTPLHPTPDLTSTDPTLHPT